VINDSWFYFFFLILPLFAGGFNKFFIIKGKDKSELTRLNRGLDLFMTIQVTIYVVVTIAKL